MGLLIQDYEVYFDSTGTAHPLGGLNLVVSAAPVAVPVTQNAGSGVFQEDQGGTRRAAVTATTGAWSLTLPWPSETRYAAGTELWQITRMDGSVYQGYIPEGVTGPVTLDNLVQNYGSATAYKWQIVASGVRPSPPFTAVPGPQGTQGIQGIPGTALAATLATIGSVLQTIYNPRDYGATGNGTTDDTAAVAATVAACIAGGGGTVLLVGTFKITTLISLASAAVPVQIMGAGDASVLLLAGSAAGFDLSSTSGCVVRDLHISSALTSASSGGSIYAYAATGLLIDHVHFTGGGPHIALSSCVQCQVRDTIHDSITITLQSCVLLYACSHCTVSGVHVLPHVHPGPSSSTASRVIWCNLGDHIAVAGCLITGVDYSAIVTGAGIAFSGSTFCTCVGCVVDHLVNADGILTENTATDIDIVGCSSCYNATTVGAAGPPTHYNAGDGCDIFNSVRVRVSGCTFRGNGTYPANNLHGGMDIYTCTDVSVTNTDISDNGEAGIIYASTTDCTLVSCIIRRNLGAGIQSSDVNSNYNTNCKLIGCEISENARNLVVNGSYILWSAANQVESVTITGAPAGGTFTLSYGGYTTTALAITALASDLQTALRALTSIGAGNVAVTGSAGGPWSVTFQGLLGQQLLTAMTSANTFTGGTSPNVVIAMTTTGGTNPVYQKYGLAIFGAANQISLIGCRLTDIQGTKTQDYGIGVFNASRVFCMGCGLAGNLTGEIDFHSSAISPQIFDDFVQVIGRIRTGGGATAPLNANALEIGDGGTGILATIDTAGNATFPTLTALSLITEAGGSLYSAAVGKSNNIRVDETTTNLVTNPSFEGGATGWLFFSDGSGTGAVDTTVAYVGQSSYKLTTLSTSLDDAQISLSADMLTPGQAATFSVYIRRSDGGDVSTGGQLLARIVDAAGNNDRAFAVITPVGNGWYRCEVPVTGISGNETVGVRAAGSNSYVFNVDAAQLEAKAYATSYCDGSLGAGYSWSGTANASTSTRGTPGPVAAQQLTIVAGGINANGLSSLNGGQREGFKIVTTNYTINPLTDYCVIAQGATLTLTLPDATTCRGQVFRLGNNNAATNTHIATVSGQTINGAASPDLSLSGVYNATFIRSDGANWLKI